MTREDLIERICIVMDELQGRLDDMEYYLSDIDVPTEDWNKLPEEDVKTVLEEVSYQLDKQENVLGLGG